MVKILLLFLHVSIVIIIVIIFVRLLYLHDFTSQIIFVVL